MVTCQQSIDKFAKAIEELSTSKYILADTKVSEVLKTVTDSELLYELFEHVAEGFDYFTFKSICLMKKDGVGRFSPPKNDDDILAFTFLLLMEIDNKTVDLLDLCESYFNVGEGKQASFDKFISDLIRPFGEIAQKIAYMLVIGDVSDEEEVKEEQKADENEAQNTGFELKRAPRIEGTLISLINKTGAMIEDCKKEKEREELEELLFVLDQFLTFVQKKDYEGITLAFTALKYMSMKIKKIKIDPDHIMAQVSEVVE